MYSVFGVVTALSVLAAASLEDIRYKKIHIHVPCFVCVAVLLSAVYEGRSSVNLFADLSLGIGLTVYSVLSHGKIGRGDGIIMCMLGLVSGGEAAVIVMIFASLLSLIYMFICLKVQKKEERGCMRDAETPFIPFVTAAYIIIIFIQLSIL